MSISKAKAFVQEKKINVQFKVDNCEESSFENGTFDIVYGAGILHHLKIDKCLNEIHKF